MSDKLILTIVSFNTMALLLPVCMFVLYKKPKYWHTTLTLFLGFLVGFIDLESDEVILPVLLLLAFGFFIGFSNREYAWAYALMIAVWVPVGAFIHLWLQPEPARGLQEGFGACISFLPAFLGVYSGVFVHRN